MSRPGEYDEPTCGPGPFSLAGADTTTDILVHAGYQEIELHRCDHPIVTGRDVEEAIDLVMALGPAGEREFEGEDGVLRAPASTWIVSATTPAI